MSKSKSAVDNRANQLNPTHPVYYRSRGASPIEALQLAGHSKPVLDNRSQQLDPCNVRFRASLDQSLTTVPSSPTKTSDRSE